MGCAGSTELEKAQLVKNREAERELKRRKEELNYEVKILLLGTSIIDRKRFYSYYYHIDTWYRVSLLFLFRGRIQNERIMRRKIYIDLYILPFVEAD